MNYGISLGTRGVLDIIFAIIWFGIVLTATFTRRRMSDEQRCRWMPLTTTLSGALFTLFATSLTLLESGVPQSLATVIILGPSIALFSYIYIIRTKCCNKCYAMMYSNPCTTPPRFCYRCGAEFDNSKAQRNDSLLE